MNEIILEMRNISKSFEQVQTLRGVDFRLRKGEIHGIVGENGHRQAMALVNILAGVHPYGTYEGEIVYRGQLQRFQSSQDSEKMGIAMVGVGREQLIPGMTVCENIFLNREITIGPIISWKKTYQKAEELLREVQLDVSPKAKVKALDREQSQRVLIAKALVKNTDVLILDHPTIHLGAVEAERIFSLLNALREAGKTLIIASSLLREFAQMDAVTVLRGGENLCVLYGRQEISESEVIRGMAGRELEDIYPEKEKKSAWGGLFGGWVSR